MKENGVKTCPKCSGIMKIGYLNNFRWIEGISLWKMTVGSRVYAFKCENCGYLELYVKKRKDVKP